MPRPTETNAWRALVARRAATDADHLRDRFAIDQGRAARYRVEAAGVTLDYARHLVDDATLGLLFDLAREMQVEAWRERMYAGQRINLSENRAVLHVALRDLDDAFACAVDGRRVHGEVRAVLAQLGAFAEAVRGGDWRGHTGRPITDVVNLGIGGSDLGPRMVCGALVAHHDGPRTHFVSNVDGHAIDALLRAVDPESTLFIVASKTFTTQETLTNAHAARSWLLDRGAPPSAVARHFVAVSTNADAVAEFGIDPANMFRFWDWVGGRYSLWSAIGLPVALAVGMPRFEALLGGAHAMDRHFREAPLEVNLPVLMALLGIWYNDFHGFTTHAVVPYDHRLRLFPAFLQQLDMESNGKGVTRDGEPVTWATGPVVWGGVGTDAQHAFFQLLHQGTHVVPVDFIGIDRPDHGLADQHRILLANLEAQADALAMGGHVGAGTPGSDVPDHTRDYPGNRPSSVLRLARLDPASLGALVALYEHKVFAQGMLLGINPFDQWGVELGKRLARERLAD